MDKWTHVQMLSQDNEIDKPAERLGLLTAVISLARRAMFGQHPVNHPLVDDIMAAQFDSASGLRSHLTGGQK
jgi:hypothetical protein